MTKRTKTTGNVTRVFLRRAAAWSAKVARLSVYFVFVAVLLAVIGFRLAVAHAKKAALDTGRELVRLTEAGNMSGTYKLRLNGELVKVTSASTDASPTAVLDRFEAACHAHADGISEDFANLRDAIATSGKLREIGHPGVGFLRQSDAEAGVVVCFATGEASGTTEIYRRVAEFAKTGDLGAIGGVRYVVAKRAKDAPTHVVALWTEGSLDVKKMFPEQGDAPGNDAPGVLRPPSARRLLTAYAEGAPYGVRVYDSTMKPEAILAEYDTVMAKLGWLGYPDATQAHPAARAFSKEGVDVIVATERSETGTSVSIVEMGAR